ncbi:hypothetical protein [Streptomyces sp. 4F14]|uniref:hypothetical protein n=1 Tax=Streptomyces sp. 4F14 TaxID=3394380 RepID=UPI003A85BA49
MVRHTGAPFSRSAHRHKAPTTQNGWIVTGAFTVGLGRALALPETRDRLFGQ